MRKTPKALTAQILVSQRYQDKSATAAEAHTSSMPSNMAGAALSEPSGARRPAWELSHHLHQ
jgi:hypothetical protein